MLEEPGNGENPALDNPKIPAGYTYFGQFVDHDITFDPLSSLQRQNDVSRLVNFRTPCLDLDNLYGEGPADEPFMYSKNDPAKLLIGEGPNAQEEDVPRNSEDVAIIGDMRNDENIIVSQVQLAFIRFHNASVDWVDANESVTAAERFPRAQQLVRWHYQYVVLNDFLKRLIDPKIYKKVIPAHESHRRKWFKWKHRAFMPVEFSVAAYRLGHSMIRGSYHLNDQLEGFRNGDPLPIFLPPSSSPELLDDLRGFRKLPEFWSLQWERFLKISGRKPQLSRKLNSKLNRNLAAIPAGPGVENALAFLNLMRGWRLGLPSGQDVAKKLGFKPLTNAQLGLPRKFGKEAPLWYYILKEAEIEGKGLRLGSVGSCIVADVFAGLVCADPLSYVNRQPDWKPVFPKKAGDYELRDIIVFAEAGVPTGSGSGRARAAEAGR